MKKKKAPKLKLKDTFFEKFLELYSKYQNYTDDFCDELMDIIGPELWVKYFRYATDLLNSEAEPYIRATLLYDHMQPGVGYFIYDTLDSSK